MKLTKDQRHTAYILMLAESEVVLKNLRMGKDTPYYKGGFIRGICETICHIADLDSELLNTIDFLGLYELRNKQPHNTNCYWFPSDVDGWQKRINLLKQCINETA